jgi:hypothetical protein
MAAECVAILTSALDSKDPWVCINAVEALGKFDQDAQSRITRLREFEQSPVRELQEAARKSPRMQIEESLSAAGNADDHAR